MKYAILQTSLWISVLASSCQAPSEPASLSSSSSTSTAKESTTKQQTNSEFLAGGAEVGDDSTKDLVKECHNKKMFFNRNENKCTTYKLAEIGCSMEKISKWLSPIQHSSLVTLLAAKGKLEGYLLDQCLDCTDPSSNNFCKGTSQTPPTEKGFRLFLVKPVSGSTTVTIQTIYIKS